MKIKNNILTIMKKECARIFSDKRLLFTAVLLPGLMIYVMYFFMGNLMGDMFEVDKEYRYQVHAVNMPASVSGLLSSPEMKIDILEAKESDIENIKQQIADKNTDLLVIFPPDFEALKEAYATGLSSAFPPNIEILSNSARTESMSANTTVTGIINAQYSPAPDFTVNAPKITVDDDGNTSVELYDMATDADIFKMVMGFMIPMMFILFLCQGCMALAPECISGEKERGTLGALLVTPTRRSDMAIAKILSITIFGLISAVGSMVAMVLSLPNLMQMGDSVSVTDIFGAGEYVLLFIIAISTTLIFVSIFSLMSAYAKSIKEATAYATPVLIVSMLCGLASMVIGGVPSEIYYYFIPVFNSALSITAIINVEVSAVNITATVLSNIVFAIIGTGVLAKMFSSEKIVFDK